MTLRRPIPVLLVLLAALCLGSPLRAQQDPERLRIAAFNLENFFDVFDDPYTADEETRVKPRGEIDALARALRRLNADVIAVCEVENEPVLRAMVQELLPDMGYEHIAVTPGNSGRGIRLGVISRLPVLSVTSYRHRPLTLPGDEREWRVARDLMHVQLRTPADRVLHVFSVHFKSKRTVSGDPESRSWRLAEATAAAGIVREILADEPHAWVAVAGDFNDTPESPPLAQLKGPDGPLVDPHADIPPSQRVTYLLPPYRSTIDYILVSPSLAEHLRPGSAEVVTDEALLSGSDHAPVVATFDIGDTRRRVDR